MPIVVIRPRNCPPTVVPAEAGNQYLQLLLDSRLRGNDVGGGYIDTGTRGDDGENVYMAMDQMRPILKN